MKFLIISTSDGLKGNSENSTPHFPRNYGLGGCLDEEVDFSVAVAEYGSGGGGGGGGTPSPPRTIAGASESWLFGFTVFFY